MRDRSRPKTLAHRAMARCRTSYDALRPLIPIRRIGNRGAAMMEFSIAAVPFMLLLFGTFELGMIFVTNLCLTNATAQIARQVRTGNVTLPGSGVTTGTGTQMTMGAFKAAVCKGSAVMPTATCLGSLQVDVRVQSSFSGSKGPSPVSNQVFSAAGFCFYSGSPGNVVTMRTYMLWPLLTPGLLNAMSNISTDANGNSGTFVLLSTSESFKNEPNPNTINTGNGC